MTEYQKSVLLYKKALEAYARAIAKSPVWKCPND